jgi:uncharacterized cupin superfamily protein
MQTYVEFSTKVWAGLQKTLSQHSHDHVGAIPRFNADDGAIATGTSTLGSAADGRPTTRALGRLASADGQIGSGVWDSTAGRHEFRFDFDEIVFFLEGEAHVTALGETYTFRAGDVALFRAGLHMTWEVPRYVRKVWVHRYPRKGLLRRAAGKLGRLVQRAL